MPHFVPDVSQFIQVLEKQEVVVGFFLIGAGLVLMLVGLKIYRVLIPASLGAIGFAACLLLPTSAYVQWICGLVAAIVLGVTGKHIIKVAVAVLGGGWAGFSSAAVIGCLGGADSIALAIGAVAGAVAVSLTFILFEQLIAFVTSLEGTLLVTSGLIILATESSGLWQAIRPLLLDNPLFWPFLVLAGTVTGFYLQLTEFRRKQTGVSG